VPPPPPPPMPRVAAKDSIEGMDFHLVSLQSLPSDPLDLSEVATCFAFLLEKGIYARQAIQ
jgi:hypothetical protein